MDSVKSSPTVLNSQFETLHICYRCAVKEHVTFQIGKIINDKIAVLSNWAPLIRGREIDLLPCASASELSVAVVLCISGRVKSYRI